MGTVRVKGKGLLMLGMTVMVSSAILVGCAGTKARKPADFRGKTYNYRMSTPLVMSHLLPECRYSDYQTPVRYDLYRDEGNRVRKYLLDKGYTNMGLVEFTTSLDKKDKTAKLEARGADVAVFIDCVQFEPKPGTYSLRKSYYYDTHGYRQDFYAKDKVKPEYDEEWSLYKCMSPASCAPVTQEELYRVWNDTSMVVEPEPPRAAPSKKAPVKLDYAYGYIGKTGEFVIRPRFRYAQSFKEGLAPVQVGEKWGFIDKGGKFAIEPKFDYTSGFSDGLAAVRVGSLWGYIDKKGVMVIKPRFTFSNDFSDGLASAQIGGPGGTFDKKGKYGVIDKSGQYVIQPRYQYMSNFSEGLAVIDVGGKRGYLDRTGKIAINTQFSGAYRFSEGLAPVKSGGKWGYIDRSGRMAIKPQFDAAYSFSEGLALIKAGKKYGFIDKKGKVVIKPRYSSLGFFSEGLTSVGDGEKSGYMDKTGKMIIKPKFRAASDFSDGLAAVKVRIKDYK